MELSLSPLQSTSTHVDWDQYMRIQIRPEYSCCRLCGGCSKNSRGCYQYEKYHLRKNLDAKRENLDEK